MNELPPTYVKNGVATSMAECLPSPKSTNLLWRILVPAVACHGQKEMSRNFRRRKKNSLQWLSATLRLPSEARCPKRRSFVGCNLTSKRSAIKTEFEAACTVSPRSEKSDSSGWWTFTTGGRLYVVAAWKDYIALCLSILVHHRGLKNLR